MKYGQYPESFYVEGKGAMAFWLIYKLTMKEQDFSFKAGEDADEVVFRNPADFLHSESMFESFIYKYGSKLVNRA